MKVVVGWSIEATSPTLVWVNGEPAKCEHKHRSVEAAVECIAKRLREGSAGDTGINVDRGQFTAPIKVGPARTVSQRMTVERLEEKFGKAGLGLQLHPLTRRSNFNQPDDREYGPATEGTVTLQAIVNAINLGEV